MIYVIGVIMNDEFKRFSVIARRMKRPKEVHSTKQSQAWDCFVAWFSLRSNYALHN